MIGSQAAVCQAKNGGAAKKDRRFKVQTSCVGQAGSLRPIVNRLSQLSLHRKEAE